MTPRDWRLKAKKTADEVGKRLGVSGRAIFKIETGETWPRPGIVFGYQLISEGGVTVGDIFAVYRKANPELFKAVKKTAVGA